MSNTNVVPLPSRQPAGWLALTAFLWAPISLYAFAWVGVENMWVFYLLFITGPVALLIAIVGTALLGAAGHSMKRAFVSFFVAVAIMLLFHKQLDFILNFLPAIKSSSWKG